MVSAIEELLKVTIKIVFSLWILTAAPGVAEAQQVAEPKVEPFRAGLKGVSSPQCLYCPAPKFSKAARKAKVESPAASGEWSPDAGQARVRSQEQSRPPCTVAKAPRAVLL